MRKVAILIMLVICSDCSRKAEGILIFEKSNPEKFGLYIETLDFTVFEDRRIINARIIVNEKQIEDSEFENNPYQLDYEFKKLPQKGSVLLKKSYFQRNLTGEKISYEFDPGTCVEGWTIPLSITEKFYGPQLTGIAAEQAIGNCKAEITINSETQSITEAINIVVENTNDTAVWTQRTVYMPVYEDEILDRELVFFEDEDVIDIPNYRLFGTCNWLNVEKETGRFYGTPRNEDIGPCSADVWVESGPDWLTTTIEIEVFSLNDKPYE